MKYCKDCKHSAPNTFDWSSPEYQRKHLNCLIATTDPVNGVNACSDERSFALFSKRCGRSANNFQAKESA